LERRCADFVLGGRRREVMKRSDVSAHSDRKLEVGFRISDLFRNDKVTL
jgi:hypothetical protein